MAGVKIHIMRSGGQGLTERGVKGGREGGKQREGQREGQRGTHRVPSLEAFGEYHTETATILESACRSSRSYLGEEIMDWFGCV